jgi:hypothetical protein
VITSDQLLREVEVLGLGLLHLDLTVHNGEASVVKVGWDLEVVLESISADWEGDSHVVADIL